MARRNMRDAAGTGWAANDLSRFMVIGYHKAAD
jgi:hypothetical protein